MNDLSRPAAPPPGPPLRLLQQIAAYRTSHCIRTAVELGIPALLQEGPQTAGELADRIGGKAELLARLLEMCIRDRSVIERKTARNDCFTTTRAGKDGVEGHEFDDANRRLEELKSTSGLDSRLYADALTLRYEARTISTGLSVAIADGSFTVIVGPNACGKSTLLRALSRLLAPAAGQVIRCV